MGATETGDRRRSHFPASPLPHFSASPQSLRKPGRYSCRIVLCPMRFLPVRNEGVR